MKAFDVSADESFIVFHCDGTTELVFPNYDDDDFVPDHNIFACFVFEMMHTINKNEAIEHFRLACDSTEP